MSKCESGRFPLFPIVFSCVLPLSLRFLTTLDDPIQSSDNFQWFLLLSALPSVCLHAPGNLPAHFRCAPHPYSALDSQNLRARSCALVSLALLVKPDQVSLGGHPFSRLQGTHPLHLLHVLCYFCCPLHRNSTPPDARDDTLHKLELWDLPICKCLLALITDSHTLNEHDLCYIESR